MQGDTLAPYLFVIVLDYAMRKAITGRENELGLTLQHRQSSRFPEQSICDLDFADDIVLSSNEIEQARKLLQSVQKECRSVGLELNAKKTEAMYFNTDVAEIDTLDGYQIKRLKQNQEIRILCILVATAANVETLPPEKQSFSTGVKLGLSPKARKPALMDATLACYAQ